MEISALIMDFTKCFVRLLWCLIMFVFRSIPHFLARQSALTFAVLYLVLIPTFGFFYWNISDQFTYSNTIAEREVQIRIEQATVHVHHELSNKIIRRLMEFKNSEKAELSYRSANILFQAKVSEEMHARLNVIQENGDFETIEILFEVQIGHQLFKANEFHYNLAAGEAPELTGLHRIRDPVNLGFYTVNWSLLPTNLLFPDSEVRVALERESRDILTVNSQNYDYATITEVLEIERSLRSYLRMTYFSVVTITTLGYGDISPISNTARVLVALESIAGLVLIGLFLNALARRRIQAVEG